MSEQTKGLRDVVAEVEKQIRKYGDEHDDGHPPGYLRDTAVFLTAHPERVLLHGIPAWLSGLYLRHDRRGRLVMAAAFMIREIDRLDRAAGGTDAE